MEFNKNGYPTRVTREPDGTWRWKYLMNPRRNKHPMAVVGKVFLIMGIVSALALRIVGSPNPTTMSDWDMPLMVLAVFGGIFLLVTGLLYLQGDDPLPYTMDEEQVTTYVGKNKGPHFFDRVRRVWLMPRQDAIRLGFGLTIYVPEEDYEAVKEHILARIPESARVRVR